MAPDTATTGITAPGVYDDLDEATYHRHPALSCSGAKRLLPPSCPAVFKWERDNGRPDKPAFDFGRAAHSLILGVGAPIFEVPHDDWRTKAAKEAADDARADGYTPLLTKDHATVQAMAAAVWQHPVARVLLDPDRGKPEQSLFRCDPDTGVMLRSRLDWLPNPSAGRFIAWDFKSAVSSEPQTFARAAATYGYPCQAAWYLDMITGLGIADDPSFLFVVQEKTAPYVVSVVELDAPTVRAGRDRNRAAIDLFAQCTAADRWPTYAEDVSLVSAPHWYLTEDFAA